MQVRSRPQGVAAVGRHVLLATERGGRRQGGERTKERTKGNKHSSLSD